MQLPAGFNYYSVEAAAGPSLYVAGDTVVGGRCAAVIVAQASLRITSQGVGRQCYDVTYSTVAGGAFFFLLDNRLYRVAA